MNNIQALIRSWRERYQALDMRGRWMTLCAAGVLLIVACWLFLPKEPVPGDGLVKPLASPQEVKKDEGGYFLGEDIDKKAYVQRLEAQYFSAAEKDQLLQGRIEDLAGKVSELSKSQGRLSESFGSLAGRIAEAVSNKAEVSSPAGAMAQQPDMRRYQMDVINIAAPVAGENDRDRVYLPAGSFVSGTLLTGVYAPSGNANPLPVLIRLKEAFYGPNGSRIPLEGALAAGKASGDLVSERALVQITTVSAVFPQGETFEHKGNIGYLTDVSGQLGLKGEVVYNAGRQLAMSFMTGFTGGAAQAMADAQTTTVMGDNGYMTRNVTGSRTKNAGFQGLAQSAAQMSKYYEDQLGNIVPAVKVEAGVDVYFIVLEGTAVYGLKKSAVMPVRYAD